MLKIDILITHKNRIKALKELLYKLYNQQNIEHFNIIILDDNSDQFDRLPVNCLRGQYGSSSKAKEAIIKYSNSDYFILIDSDDLPTSDFCSKIITNFNKDFDVNSFLFFDETDMKIPKKYLLTYNHYNILKFCLLRYPAVIKRSAYEKVGGFDTSLLTCGDVDLYWRLYLNDPTSCRKIMIPILIKRQIDKSISLLYSREQQKTFATLQNKYLKRSMDEGIIPFKRRM